MENIKWEELGFGYIRTDFNIRSTWKNGEWSTPRLTEDENVNIHMASTALHYGQTAFEGAKAFRGADGRIRLFRIEENAKRLQSSAEYLMMAVPPVELMVKMTEEVVRANARWVPPYGSGASLYIRPFLFGAGANVGVKPADQYELIIFVTPVGPYFKGKLIKVYTLTNTGCYYIVTNLLYRGIDTVDCNIVYYISFVFCSACITKTSTDGEFHINFATFVYRANIKIRV